MRTYNFHVDFKSGAADVRYEGRTDGTTNMQITRIVQLETGDESKQEFTIPLQHWYALEDAINKLAEDVMQPASSGSGSSG